MASRVSLVIVMLALSAPAFAAQPKSARQRSVVSPALLEFIGSWQGKDGHWVDPMTFVQVDPAALAREKAQHKVTGMQPATTRQVPPDQADEEQSP